MSAALGLFVIVMVLVGFTFRNGDDRAQPSSTATTSTTPAAGTTPAVRRAPTSSTTPATTTVAPVEVLGAEAQRGDGTSTPTTEPPTTQPPTTQPPTTEAPPPAPSRSYLYGPNAGFPRNGVISVGSAIDAPALSAAIDYWNSMAGRTIFVLGGSPQITVRGAEGICGAPSVACAAPASVYDHTWHPDMSYPYASCEVYVLAEYVTNSWTIAHELGHCLGFDHINDRASIMNSPPNPDPARDRDLLVSAGYVN